jgi:hypothetical protein
MVDESVQMNSELEASPLEFGDTPRKSAAAPPEGVIFRYEGEDDREYLFSNERGGIERVRKNRAPLGPEQSSAALVFVPAIRLIMLAFIGLAPAGIGTLIFSPLAVLWVAGVCVTRRLKPPDWIRAGAIIALSAGLFAIAWPVFRLYQSRFP